MPAKAPQSLYIPAPKLNQLHIMQEIALNPRVTQAELAQRCSLSVAMVNNYMKELSAVGYLEYHRKSSKSVSYHITQAGREAEDATRHELVQVLVGLFADAKERILQLIFSRAGGEIHRVVLYGSGDLAELAFHALEAAEVDIVGVCDDAPAKIGRDWCGREMLNPSQIRFLAPDSVIIADSGHADGTHQGLSYLLDRGIRLICLNHSDAFSIKREEKSVTSEPEDRSLQSVEKAL